MSFLDALFDRNPTRDWRPQRGLEITCDLDSETFCGVAFGERIERLAKLGPAEVAGTARKGIYEYASKGFRCVAEDGRLVVVEIFFLTDPSLGAFVGTVRYRGGVVSLSAETTEAEVRGQLGDPREREQDIEGEPFLQLTYGLHRSDWIFEFENDRLESLWGERRLR